MSGLHFAQWGDIFTYPLVVVTKEGVIEEANQSFRQHLGLDSIPRGLPLHNLTLVPPQEVAEYLHRCARSRQFHPGSLRFKTDGSPDGTVFRCDGALLVPASEQKLALILLRLTPKAGPDEFQLLKRQIESMNQEIRRRMAVERELERQQRWLQVTLSSISDAVIATDLNGRIVFMNPTASSFTGWAIVDAMGQTLENVFRIVNEDSRLPVANPVHRTLREGVITGLANHTLLIARDGSTLPIDDGAAPIRDETGRIQGVVLVFHEVRSQRDLERSLREQTQRLTEENRRKDEYLAMLAHELRNPLAPIGNTLAILQKMPELPPTVKETCQVAEQQLNHLRHLIDDLLDVSRLTRGKIEIRKQPVELMKIVSEALNAIRPHALSRGVALSIEPADHPIGIEADAFRIAQVVSNLLHNAIKYTPQGGTVTVRTFETGEQSVISVKDTGAGIPATLMPYIFDLFVQGDQSISRTEGGLGIGLTLVRSIVAMHGGTVTAHSDGPGQGSEFLVSLPRCSLPADVGRPASRPVVAPRPARAAQLRILLVDDNPALVATLAQLLRLSGHTTETAVNGAEALERVTTFKPQVVLLDIGLPGMDGFAVARQIRLHYQAAALRIVAVSGYGQKEYKTLAREAGCDAYLVKPIDHDELDQLIAVYATEV